MPGGRRQRKRPAQVTALEESIVDYIAGEAIKETEKEKVRQRITRALVHEHGIDPADMARDFRVMISEEGAQRKRTKSADIAIFESGSLHTTANLRRVVICKPEPKSMGTNVVKLREPDQARKDLEALQELMGNEDRPLCADGMWTDGVDFFFLKKVISDFGADFEDRSDWAIADGTLGSRTVASRRDCGKQSLNASGWRSAAVTITSTATRACRRTPRSGSSFTCCSPRCTTSGSATAPDAARFYTRAGGDVRGDGQKAIRARIEDLFEEVKREYKDVFEPLR